MIQNDDVFDYEGSLDAIVQSLNYLISMNTTEKKQIEEHLMKQKEVHCTNFYGDLVAVL